MRLYKKYSKNDINGKSARHIWDIKLELAEKWLKIATNKEQTCQP